MEDPIVSEVRRVREQIMAQFGYDLRRYLEYLREQEQKPRQAAHADPDEIAQHTPPAVSVTGTPT